MLSQARTLSAPSRIDCRNVVVMCSLHPDTGRSSGQNIQQAKRDSHRPDGPKDVRGVKVKRFLLLVFAIAQAAHTNQSALPWHQQRTSGACFGGCAEGGASWVPLLHSEFVCLFTYCMLKIQTRLLVKCPKAIIKNKPRTLMSRCHA